MLNDFRLALRTLRRSPTFVVVATLTLGIGIGLTTTMLSMLDAIRHPYVPYRNPEQLFSVIAYGGGGSGAIGPYERGWALIEGTRSFAGVASSNSRGQGQGQVSVGGRIVSSPAILVSDNYFDLLGVKLELGRGFSTGRSAAEESGAVIGYGLWQRAFNSAPLDRRLSITVGDRTYGVIGVMPPASRGTSGGVWVRAAADVPNTGAAIVRLRDGVTLQMAYAELSLVAARLKAVYGEGKQPFQFRLDPLQPPPQELKDYHKAMGGAAIAILLIACANLANLMLVRGLSRRKELSLRLALGAGRSALIRQLLAESAVVGTLGGLAGTLMAVWGIDTVRHFMPVGTAFGFVPPRLSGTVYLVALAVTFAAVLVFGLGPAIIASGVRLIEPLKETIGTANRSTRRWSTLVVVAEVAICLVLLMGSGLLLRASGRVAAFDFGYDGEGLVAAMVNLPSRTLNSDSAVPAIYRNSVAGLSRMPVVRSVATYRRTPTMGGALTSDLEGPEPRFVTTRFYRVVSAEFLRTLGVPVIKGRDFDPGDEYASAPLAIVGEETATALWGDVDPVGRMIKLGNASAPGDWVRVIGIAKQVSLSFRDDPSLSDLPMALVLRPGDRTSLRYVVTRVAGNQEAATLQLDQELRALFPSRAGFMGVFQPWLAAWEGVRDGRDLLARLFSVFGLVALGLAAVGVYGVLAYAVGQRLREFGVRIALGALPRDLVKLVARDAAIMILGGTAVGGFLAMAGSRFLDFWLFDVAPTDAVSLVGAEAALLLVAFLACLAPARRAARADPLQIIRAL